MRIFKIMFSVNSETGQGIQGILISNETETGINFNGYDRGFKFKSSIGKYGELPINIEVYNHDPNVASLLNTISPFKITNIRGKITPTVIDIAGYVRGMTIRIKGKFIEEI